MLASIKSETNESTAYNGSAGEVTTLARVMRSFLTLDPAQRPRVAQALLLRIYSEVTSA